MKWWVANGLNSDRVIGLEDDDEEDDDDSEPEYSDGEDIEICSECSRERFR